MAQTVYSSPPRSLTAGDTYHWSETPEDIDAVSSFVYLFRSTEDSDESFQVAGTLDSGAYRFEITGTSADGITPGELQLKRLITYSWGRESEDDGVCLLFPNPTADPVKSHTQKMVTLLEAHIEGRFPDGLESHQIGGVPINKIAIPDAEILLTKYQSKLRAEKAADLRKKNPNRGSGNNVQIHF